MKVSTANTKVEIRRWFTIAEDHPVVGMACSRPPKKVRIEHGHVDYRWINGEWVVKSWTSVSVAGTVLKKDGSDSLNQHSRNMPPRFDDDPTAAGSDWAWLQPIIDLLRPSGDISMVALDAHVIGDVLG